MQDAQRAMCIIRANAQKWGIQTDKIGVMGASAGGHSIALRNNPGSAELWTAMCEKWLIEIGIITNLLLH